MTALYTLNYIQRYPVWICTMLVRNCRSLGIRFLCAISFHGQIRHCLIGSLRWTGFSGMCSHQYGWRSVESQLFTQAGTLIKDAVRGAAESVTLTLSLMANSLQLMARTRLGLHPKYKLTIHVILACYVEQIISFRCQTYHVCTLYFYAVHEKNEQKLVIKWHEIITVHSIMAVLPC